ncbi:hemolysin family protein [Halolamina litorea]|uniref:Hemolysin family protein n=1 Tax=Halolamina litorea TaxID=1515593 RepID=A0ABD6BQ11_9EURY|nr:hemolysin family protein [Halolamina litorea]
METFELTARLLAGVGLILANGFFVAIEFALTRARQFSKEEFLGDGGNKALERAWEMTNDLELYLTTCQVGITASSIAVGIVAEPALAAIFEPVFEPVFEGTMFASAGAGAVLAFLIINLVHLTHGEQTPTYLGVERSRLVCQYGATPLYWCNRLILPIIKLGDWVAKGTLRLFGVEMTGAWLETEEDAIESRADLHKRLGSVLSRGDLSEDRRAEIMNALTIGDRAVDEVMVPESDIVALSTEADTAENFRRMEEHPHTRYPLIGEDLSDFRGIVYFPMLARYRDGVAEGEIDFTNLSAPPMTLSGDTSVSDAIDQFQVESQELALVVEDGEVVGMVTVTDLLESITGEMEDPLDAVDPDR